MKHKEKFIKKGVGIGKRADTRPATVYAKEESAITLIALVITIIVLLILAGVTIAMVVGDNGILTRARQAKSETETAEFVEKVQVAAVGSLNTDGRVDLDNLKSELEKIDIETDAEEFPVIVEKNDEKLFIYDDGEVVKDSSNEYIKNGLMVAYDGINNTGNGHNDTATVWKDLSGNGNDGTLKGEPTWQNDCLKFNGTDSWVDIGKMNYENVTLEAVVMNSNEIKDIEVDYMCNFEGGGYGFLYNSLGNHIKNTFLIYIGNEYKFIQSNDDIVANKIYCLSGNYNGNELKLFENGQRYFLNMSGNVQSPAHNVDFVLGGNVSASNVVAGDWFERKYVCS